MSIAKINSKIRHKSFLRTEAYQNKLIRQGISDAEGDEDNRRSVHTTGAAFDISKKPMTPRQIRRLRKRLLRLERLGVIEATEEMCSNAFILWCFRQSMPGSSPDSFFVLK